MGHKILLGDVILCPNKSDVEVLLAMYSSPWSADENQHAGGELGVPGTWRHGCAERSADARRTECCGRILPRALRHR